MHNSATFQLHVESALDAHGEPQPQRFALGRRVVEVEAVLDRWPGSDHAYVKLRAADGIYLLRHDRSGGRWHLLQFRRAEDHAPRG